MATRGKKEKEYPPMPANWMYKRGDVYMMDLNPYSGSEQGGIRPAIVVQNDDGNFYSNVLLVVPLTTQIKKRNMPTHFIGHKAATALRPIGSVTEKSKHKPSPSQKWQNCSAFQEKRSTGFSTAKNTETVSLLSAWPTDGALPKPALKHGFSVNLHIRFSHRPKMFQKNLH